MPAGSVLGSSAFGANPKLSCATLSGFLREPNARAPGAKSRPPRCVRQRLVAYIRFAVSPLEQIQGQCTVRSETIAIGEINALPKALRTLRGYAAPNTGKFIQRIGDIGEVTFTQLPVVKSGGRLNRVEIGKPDT